jgi:hypothetical protein
MVSYICKNIIIIIMFSIQFEILTKEQKKYERNKERERKYPISSLYIE